MDNNTPAPLNADSLRQQWFDILEKAGFNENERLVIERLAKPYIAAALQAERQRIADSLPKKRNHTALNTPSFDYYTDKGFDQAIEAVRAVLIPPTGSSPTSVDASAQGHEADNLHPESEGER